MRRIIPRDCMRVRRLALSTTTRDMDEEPEHQRAGTTPPEGMLVDALEATRSMLADTFRDHSLKASFSWSIGGRAVSEIGGRLIEDFALDAIAASVKRFEGSTFDRIDVEIPTSGRTVEDFALAFQRGSSRLDFLVDVKGHNELRTGSRPNLASIRKCLALYSEPLASTEIIIFFCRYLPNIKPGERSRTLTLQIMDDSFRELCIFPLRWLSRSNLDVGNIGAGGQLLLARENQVQLELRTRTEFVALLQLLQQKLPRLPLR